MAVSNPIQFAIVREDPAVEVAVLDRLAPDATRALLVASGGCTALSLATLRPEVALTLVDANVAQLELVARKVAALRAHPPGSTERARTFGVGRDDAAALSCCGNFESLFRGLRGVLDELVLSAEDRKRLLLEGGDRAPLVDNPYWPVAFSLFFSDAFLEAMFGRDATQHAAPGSYPAYFQRVVERGLARADAAKNPFLHHVLLGHWLDGALPPFLEAPCDARFERVHATMADAPCFSRFDLVSLSNLFDWMDDDGIQRIAGRLKEECRPGTVVVLRQLNNAAPVERFFEAAFRREQALGDELLEKDQSLFYERLHVFVRTP